MSSFRRLSSVFLSLSVVATAALAAAQPAPEAPAEQTEPTAPPVVRELPSQTNETEKVLTPVAGGLTADQVARRTVASSATVRAKLAEVEAAEAKVTQTAVQFFPRVTLKATYTRLSPVSSGFGSGALVGAGNPGLLTVGACPGGVGQCVLDSQGQPVGAAAFSIESLQNNYALSAQLAVPISDYVTRLSSAIAGSKAGKRSAQLAHKAERLKVQSDARTLFYTWVLAKGQVSVAEKSLERVRARKKDAEAAYSLGTISKADLMRLEALVANTELSVKEAQTFEKLSKDRLGIVMGEKTPQQHQIGEDVLAPARSGVQGNVDQLVNEALSRRLELKALQASSSALHHGASAASAGKWPRLDALAEITYANPNQRYFPPTNRWDSTWSAGLSATWTLNEVFGGAASTKELEANARSVEAQRSALSDGIRQEVIAAYLDREKSRVAVQTSARAVKAAEEAYRVATDLYRVGRATTTELIDAESDLLQARLGVLSANVGLRVAEVRLRHAVGRDVRSS